VDGDGEVGPLALNALVRDCATVLGTHRVMVVYLAVVTQKPAGLAFGPILGLLIFIFTVSQFLLFLTAWAATARENQVERPPPVPPPAVIRPEVTVRSGLGPGAVTGLLGAGAITGLLGCRLLGRRK
jgi:membrane protein